MTTLPRTILLYYSFSIGLNNLTIITLYSTLTFSYFFHKTRVFILVINDFTVRLHVLQRMVLLSKFSPSVRLSDTCIVTKLNEILPIFWYYTKRQSL